MVFRVDAFLGGAACLTVATGLISIVTYITMQTRFEPLVSATALTKDRGPPGWCSGLHLGVHCADGAGCWVASDRRRTTRVGAACLTAS